MFIATLIAARSQGAAVFSDFAAALAQAGCQPGELTLLDPRAAEIRFVANLTAAEGIKSCFENKIDIIIQNSSGRRKQLLVADMDSTMITVECIDELADYAGIKPQIAAITEQAMQGKLDFAEALHARVALLAGLEESVLQRCYDERVHIMPGAKALVRTMVAAGAEAVLVSGGFTFFAEKVAQEIGFTRFVANRLEIIDGRLSGRLLGPIIDAKAKADSLIAAADAAGLALADTLAVGDGANDRMMVAAAGLGIAYRAKPQLAEMADAAIRHGNLSALLHAQGYARKEWASARRQGPSSTVSSTC